MCDTSVLNALDSDCGTISGMSIQTFLSLMSVGSALAWFAWAVTLFRVNPFEMGVSALVMFYLTLSIALVGTLTVIGSVLRIHLLRREVHGREIRTAFRHAVLFAAIAIATLILSAAGKFQTYHTIIAIAIASIIEYFFLQWKQGRG